MRPLILVVLAVLALPVFAADKKSELPALAGYEPYGRIFVWQDGAKVFVTPPWERNVLGGGAVSGDKNPVWSLWGWTIEPPRIRFWTLEVELGKPAKPGQAIPIRSRVFVRDDFGVAAPDLAYRSGDSEALVYGAVSTLPRWEIWAGGRQIRAKAWDDGRVYYGVAVSTEGDIALTGRSGAGEPLFETAETTDVMSGYAGRLAAVLWNPVRAQPGWQAVGWGALSGRAPAFVAFDGSQWLGADASVPPDPHSAGVLPLLTAFTPTGDLLAAGISAEKPGSGTQAWVWEPTGPRWLEQPGNPRTLQAFAASSDAGWDLVMKTSDGFFLTGDSMQTPLDGLGEGDRIVVVAPPSSASPPAAPAAQ